MKVKRVEKQIITKSDKNYNSISELCFKSKNLYNYVNYILRQSFIKENKLPQEYDVTTQLAKEKQVDYIALPNQSSQQIIKLLYKNWKSFFKSMKEFKKNLKKFKGMPKLPKYKDKVKGRNIVIFSNQVIKFKNDYFNFPNKANLNPIKSNVDFKKLNQIRIIPQSNCYVLEIVYEKEIQEETKQPKNYLSIDLGVTNFATCYDSHANKAFIINGGIIKSINQYFNKKKSVLQSYIGDKGTSNKIKNLTLKRNNKVNDFMHKASRFLINYCKNNEIDTIVIGHNKNWKQEVNNGSQNNQNFVGIPFNKFISQLEYKCQDCNLNLIKTEESYTSKVDHLVLESLEHHENYLGKRKYRGLFKSSNGKAINADLNGSIGILRKVIDESSFKEIVNRGLILNPIKINNFNKEF